MGIGQELIVHAASAINQGNRLDLTKPRYDQSTFPGRYQHFFKLCNPVLLLKSNEDIISARDVVYRYIKGEKFPNMTDEQIWESKYLLYSAVHPKTNQPIPLLARMAAQCPVNMLIVGAMLTFYKTKKEIIFWQWTNQSFNAFVNQCNSSNPSGDLKEGLKNYAIAVSLALSTAVALSHFASKLGMIVQRLVPFASIALTTSLNLPLSRQGELKEGIELYMGNEMNATNVGKSKKLAKAAITSTIISRIVMSMPHMILIPLVMTRYISFFRAHRYLAGPFQFSATGILLFWGTPLGCAMFPQHIFVPVEELEPEVQESIKKMKNPPKTVFYNRGL